MKRHFIAVAALMAGFVIGALLAVQMLDRPSNNLSTVNPIISYKMPHVKRPNLLVADLDRSLAVYRDILGLSATGLF